MAGCEREVLPLLVLPTRSYRGTLGAGQKNALPALCPQLLRSFTLLLLGLELLCSQSKLVFAGYTLTLCTRSDFLLRKLRDFLTAPAWHERILGGGGGRHHFSSLSASVLDPAMTSALRTNGTAKTCVQKGVICQAPHQASAIQKPAQ